MKFIAPHLHALVTPPASAMSMQVRSEARVDASPFFSHRLLAGSRVVAASA